LLIYNWAQEVRQGGMYPDPMTQDDCAAARGKLTLGQDAQEGAHVSSRALFFYICKHDHALCCKPLSREVFSPIRRCGFVLGSGPLVFSTDVAVGWSKTRSLVLSALEWAL
jgi:hypothetical protein